MKNVCISFGKEVEIVYKAKLSDFGTLTKNLNGVQFLSLTTFSISLESLFIQMMKNVRVPRVSLSDSPRKVEVFIFPSIE